jgi:hypothetical protein
MDLANPGWYSLATRLSDGRRHVVLAVRGDDGKETNLTLSIEGAARLEQEARKARRQATTPFRKVARIVGYVFLLPALYFGLGLELTWLASFVGWHPMEYNREIFVGKDFVTGCLTESTEDDPDHVDAARFTACLERWGP